MLFKVLAILRKISKIIAANEDQKLVLEEIAEILGIPAGTARSRLHHAHRSMRAVSPKANLGLRPPREFAGRSRASRRFRRRPPVRD